VPFATGTLVEYAGSRWRVQRVLGVEAVLLRSDAGDEVSADPLKLRLSEASLPARPARPVVDELRYSDADWAEVSMDSVFDVATGESWSRYVRFRDMFSSAN